MNCSFVVRYSISYCLLAILSTFGSLDRGVTSSSAFHGSFLLFRELLHEYVLKRVDDVLRVYDGAFRMVERLGDGRVAAGPREQGRQH